MQYETQNVSNNLSKGKQISSISKLRQQFIELTKKCKVVDENKVPNISNVEPPNDNAIILDTVTHCVDTRIEIVEAIPIRTNDDNNIYNGKLTKQVLYKHYQENFVPLI